MILRVLAAIAVITSAVIFVPWRLVWPWLSPLPDTIQEQANDAVGHGFDGIIVYVDQAGKDPGFYAAGWNNREERIPADPRSLFKIASIGKLYVAAAITKLASNQVLSLEDPLTDHFPELAGRIENADKITLRLMLQHRSGIPNYTDIPGYWVDPPESSEETLALILDLPANFEPDEDYGYSNTNYLLLTGIIDRVVGYDHRRVIEEQILVPLELNNTFSSIHEVDIDDVMSGYYVGIERDIKAEDYGSMLATAQDVGAFLRALNDGSLFDEAEQEMYSAVYVYDHTGLIPGYQSIAKYHRDIDTVVVQFVNTTDFSDYTNWVLSEIVYNRIVRILHKN